jgi:hypothetical protein
MLSIRVVFLGDSFCIITKTRYKVNILKYVNFSPRHFDGEPVFATAISAGRRQSEGTRRKNGGNEFPRFFGFGFRSPCGEFWCGVVASLALIYVAV